MNLSMKHKSNKDLLYSIVNSTQNSVMEKYLKKKSGDIYIYILKEISSGCSLEGLMLKLKLQYFGHLM